jgi:hypothetical protein
MSIYQIVLNFLSIPSIPKRCMSADGWKIAGIRNMLPAR